MKTTPFTEKHIALGAKMHEFAGYTQLSGIVFSNIWAYLFFVFE